MWADVVIGFKYFGERVFFFNDTATTEIYTLSLHDALPIYLTACSLELNCASEASKLVRKPTSRRAQQAPIANSKQRKLNKFG